ncbi:MAG TPA: type II and III secretion system protein family protein [Xanthobacteraceae bacterium]|nr:type II and III secretion system protein family protein [Xanthobacteraceae bacterium]
MSLAAAGLFAMAAHGVAKDFFDDVVVGRPSIDLAVGEGRILRFDGPVESVFIADSSIADVRVVSADVVYVYGKKSGMTNLIATSVEQRIRAQVQLRIATNAQPANDARRKLQPTSTVDISILGERAAATGRTRRIEEAVDAENVGEIYSPPGQPPINNTTIEGSQQINIRVRFAEVSRQELQALGFSWKIFAGAGSLGFGNRVDIDVIIEALQRNGVLTILAEPNLTAVTGQTASFLAGGEVPVPLAQPNGLVSVEYKPFGVSLEFMPTIIRTNRIALHVRPQVSTLMHIGEVKVSGLELPSFTVRRADTTVEVASGQTFAIAGLFQRQLTQDLDKFPLLAEVPVLGALFTSERFRRNETELVILITPYLVKPTRDRTKVATPLDRPTPPPPPAPAPVRKPSGSERSSGSGLIFK